MVATFALPTLAVLSAAVVVYAAYELGCFNQSKVDSKAADEDEENEKDKEKFKFTENPDDLLPDLPRDDKGRIQTADNLRIRPEKHSFNKGDRYNPTHHEQHYHVETRKNPDGGWRKNNIEKMKPQGYENGAGTGFLPGETYPGIL